MWDRLGRLAPGLGSRRADRPVFDCKAVSACRCPCAVSLSARARISLPSALPQGPDNSIKSALLVERRPASAPLHLEQTSNGRLVLIPPRLASPAAERSPASQYSSPGEATEHEVQALLACQRSVPTARPVAFPQLRGLAERRREPASPLALSVVLLALLPLLALPSVQVLHHLSGLNRSEASTSAGVFGLAPAEPFTTNTASPADFAFGAKGLPTLRNNPTFIASESDLAADSAAAAAGHSVPAPAQQQAAAPVPQPVVATVPHVPVAHASVAVPPARSGPAPAAPQWTCTSSSCWSRCSSTQRLSRR